MYILVKEEDTSSANRPGNRTRLRFAGGLDRVLHHKGAIRVLRAIDADVFYTAVPVGTEIVIPQAVRLFVYEFAKSRLQLHILSRIQLAFED